MATIPFDTLKFVRTLKNAGAPESQAEGFSEAFKGAQGEAEFTSQRDINDLRRDIDMRFNQVDLQLIQLSGTIIKLIIKHAAFVAALSLFSPAHALYTAIDLGTFGGTTSYSNGINDAGQVTGSASYTIDNAPSPSTVSIPVYPLSLLVNV